MPIYEYQCTQCENRFEELVSSREDNADLVCPQCKSSKIFRVAAPFAVGHCGSASPVSSAGCSGKPGGGRGYS